MQKDENKKPVSESKLVYRSALLTGFLVIGAALFRALSVNNLVIGAATNDISKHYSTSVIIDWSLSSAMMLLVGIWVLFLSSSLKKLQRKAWWQGIIISLFFILFGAGFWYRYPKSIHLPGFILLGLILFVPLLIFGGKFKSEKN
ncbi:MAG TPA: hypothetical protein VKT28_21600 [Puia sp.]|nr:hypothetical protein [Puia sp.]